ncbi:unnamed protein product, partial [Leptidea sinapis]
RNKNCSISRNPH